VGAALATGIVPSTGAADPIRIGVINGSSGPYAAARGRGSVIAAQLAIADPGGQLAIADPGGQLAIADPGGQLAIADPGGQLAIADPGGQVFGVLSRTWPADLPGGRLPARVSAASVRP
jgi:hypothetical protein